MAVTADIATKSDVFIALITAEGLLFAALSVTSAIAGGSAFGPKTVGPQWTLSVVASVILTLVAAATVLAWADLFAGRAWSHSLDRKIEAVGLLVAVVAQPLIAALLSVGLIQRRRG